VQPPGKERLDNLERKTAMSEIPPRTFDENNFQKPEPPKKKLYPLRR
jgi:hypothetical protein